MLWLPIPGTKNAKNKEIFEWISATWYRIVGSGDEKHLKAGTRIEPIETWGGVIYYICKIPGEAAGRVDEPLHFAVRRSHVAVERLVGKQCASQGRDSSCG